MPIDPKYIQLIKAGEVVAFPTETVYGLGADAWNPSAIQKVFEVKGRPSDNPLIVHISIKEQVEAFALEIPETAEKLITAFWPGPLSLVLKKKQEVLDAVTAGLNTVAIRMPDHPKALEFISQTGALVAPSANKSGRPSPTKAEHVLEDFGTDFAVIDGEATKIGLESTVIDLSGEQPIILRPGSIGKQEIEEILGVKVHEYFSKKTNTPKSPGQKYSHYKPNAEIRWLSGIDDLKDSTTLFLLLNSYEEAPNIINFQRNIEVLAKELYDRFRQADIEGFDSVAIEPFGGNDHPIVPALLNRVEKALIS